MPTSTPPPSSPTPRDPDRRATPDDRAAEHDPTGVRALLAGLPDPGPMPEHLVRRIEARLEVEQAHRSAGEHPIGGHADRVVDLAAARSQRRPGRTLAVLGAAAAGLIVTTVALTQTVGSGGADSGTAAQYPSPASGQAGDDAAGDAEAGADSAEGEEEAADDAAAGSAAAADDSAVYGSESEAAVLESGGVVLLPDLGRVGPGDLEESLRLAQAEVAANDAETAALVSLSEGQALSCWSTVDDGWAERYATAAEYAPTGGGVEDVVVLLGLAEDGSGRSWVVPADCVAAPDVPPLDPAGEPIEVP